MRINLYTSTWRFKNLLLFCLLLAGAFLHAQALISGRITLPDGVTGVQGVAVSMTGTDNDVTLTDATGYYTFAASSGGSYVIRPYANLNPLDGVTTYDLTHIGKHLSGEEPFNTPYEIIASDVDDSQSITSQDTTTIRELILGFIAIYPSNESFRFVPTNYVFPNPSDPFPYPRTITVNNLSAHQTDVDFIAIKLGDVNFSASLNEGLQVDDPNLSRIVGTATWDSNLNCSQDASETPLGDWLVVASGLPGQFIANTKNDGSYKISVPEGDYTVSLIKPNGLWSVCTPPQQIQVGIADTLTIPLLAQADKYCPFMEVDLSTPFLRRCLPSYYVLKCCNKGTLGVVSPYVEVELDAFITLTNSTVPWTAHTGNSYTFPIDNLAPGECRSIALQVVISCESDLGQTHCSTAHLFPDDLCGPVLGLWDGSDLRVTANCNGNEVAFQITNNGADMTEPAEYVIIEDIMIQMVSDPIQLNNGGVETVSVPANGSTWRLEINQSADYPLGLRASAAVEGCGTNASGGESQGFITLFPQNDAAYFIDEDCTANQGSFDPNDKQGFPTGVGAAHYIPKGEEIEYLIRFQNTGTDTAFTVMVMDTISSLFDLGTLRTGASSHPYTYNLLGQGVAQFVFSNIMLPDSNVNEAASHGFVKFKISPKAGLPDNTQLENEAGIYFDFNDPVITNRTLHTIGENYLEVTGISNLQPNVHLSVFPNPAVAEATFQLETSRTLEGFIALYDMQGHIVKRVPFTSNTFRVHTSDLPSGHYVFRLDAGGTSIATGKIMVVHK